MTPPPPSRDDLKRSKERHELSSAVLDFMMDFLLSGNAPESEKVPLRVAKALKTTEDYLHGSFSEYFNPEAPKNDELMALQYEVIEYLQLVRAGLKSFVDQHPIPRQ